MKIKFTNKEGNVSYPADLQNLSYKDAVNQLKLLGQPSGLDTQFEPEFQGEDVLVRNYTNDEFEIFEIEKE